MNKSLKAFALLVAMTSAIPAIADNSSEVQPGAVVGTIGGSITQTTEQTTTKNESKLQRLYNFVSKNKENIAFGIASAIVLSLGAYLMYDLFYVTGPANKKIIADAKELHRQGEVVIEALKKIGEITKDLPTTQQS